MTMEGLPDPKLLEGIKEVEDTEPVETVEASQTTDPELVGSSKGLPNNRPTVTKSHCLPAPGLPTIPNKLAQKIWDLEFVEMEEFLPSNKTIQAMENPVSIQEGIQEGDGYSHLDPLFLLIHCSNGCKTPGLGGPHDLPYAHSYAITSYGWRHIMDSV